MITNYIKLALRILGRRKFFTFISLFGISFTLGILMVVISFMQTEMGTNKPLTNKNDFVIVEQLKLKRTYYDTLVNVDTIIDNGFAVYDTTFEYKSKGSGTSQSEINSDIVLNYLKDLPAAKDVSMFAGMDYNVYVNGIKLTLRALMTDASYWSVFDHTILEGTTFNQTDVSSSSQVILISNLTAKNYFDSDENVVGKEMILDGKTYKIIGMYDHVGKVIQYVSPDVVIPYTNYNLANQDDFYNGPFSVMLQKHSDQDAQRLKDEIDNAATLVPLDHPDNTRGYQEIVFAPMTYNEMFAQALYWEEDASKSLAIMKWILMSLLAFFIILPTLNLINLNVSRIMDRSSEIGVRKAFGANQGHIIGQFIIENIVQTLIGGLLGLALAWGLINLINKGGLLGKAELLFQPRFFLYSFIITIIFGIFSGFVPAFRMSKLQIVKALKQNKL